MIVRTFTGSTVREALDKVRESFGPEAVILDTKFDRSVEARQGTSSNTVAITAAFETDTTSPPEVEGKKTLQVDESLIEDQTTSPSAAELGDDAPAPAPAPAAPASTPADEQLAELIRRLHADVRESLGLRGDSSIWDALRRWLGSHPELANGVIDAFTTDVAESLPPNDAFLERQTKGMTALFVGARGSGKSTALFKCLAARWQARDRKPRLLTLSETEEHGQERLLNWCARCDIQATAETMARAGRLSSFRRRQDEDLFVEYIPGADVTAIETSARAIRRSLKPDAVVTVLPASARPSTWRADCTRLTAFASTHLVVTRWDDMTPWWEVAQLLRDHHMLPAYRVGGCAPFAEYEPFSTADWRAGIAACLALEIGAAPVGDERGRTS